MRVLGLILLLIGVLSGVISYVLYVANASIYIALPFISICTVGIVNGIATLITGDES